MGLKYPLSIVVRAVDKATAPLRAINASVAAATRPLVVGFARVSNRLGALASEARFPQLVDGFKRAGTALQGVGREAWALGKQLAAAAVVGGTVFFSLLHGAIEAGDKLGEMSQRVGLSANAYAQLQFAAEQADVSQEQFASSMDRFNRSLGEAKAGGGPLLAFLQKVSPALARQVQHIKGVEDGLGLMNAAFQKVKDPAKTAALAAAAFGKGNVQMGQFLGMSREAIDALGQRFKKLSPDQKLFVKRTGEADNALRESRVAMLGVRNTLVTGLLPAVTKLATALADFVAKHREGLAAWAEKTGSAISAWVDGGGLERLGATLQNVADTLGDLVDSLGGAENVVKLVAVAMSAKLVVAAGESVVALVQLGGAVAGVAVRLGALLFGPVVAAVGAFITAIGAGTGVMGAFNAVLLANPIGAAVALVALLAGGAYLVYRNWGPIKKFLGGLWDDTIGGWKDAWTGLKAFFGGLWDDIAGFFASAWERIKPIVDLMMEVAKFSPIGLAVQAGQAAAGWWNKQGGATPTSPAPTPLRPPAGAQGGETRVVVDFNGLPRGARVQADPRGDAPLDLNIGRTMVGG